MAQAQTVYYKVMSFVPLKANMFRINSNQFCFILVNKTSTIIV